MIIYWISNNCRNTKLWFLPNFQEKKNSKQSNENQSKMSLKCISETNSNLNSIIMHITITYMFMPTVNLSYDFI